jgi:hypothetical protein
MPIMKSAKGSKKRFIKSINACEYIAVKVVRLSNR